MRFKDFTSEGSKLEQDESSSPSTTTNIKKTEERTEIVPKRHVNEQIFEAPITFLTLPKRFVGKLAKSDTTPKVRNVEHWVTKNTVPVTVTDFLDGQEGQSLKIVGDGMTTLQHTPNIFTKGGANLLLAANTLYILEFIQGKWYQA
ncbi:MAG: hypothetical protein COW67_03020 [Flavobacteriales bacterium CG18_big_fil_WC_8_21_14_2_50_32_9]|nr:MAG: hypothetical protein COW67_03020 [Flavobacteriales bacterium CG18_big_fil_WC_8_21_14_2_50_32_9]